MNPGDEGDARDPDLPPKSPPEKAGRASPVASPLRPTYELDLPRFELVTERSEEQEAPVSQEDPEETKDHGFWSAIGFERADDGAPRPGPTEGQQGQDAEEDEEQDPPAVRPKRRVARKTGKLRRRIGELESRLAAVERGPAAALSGEREPRGGEKGDRGGRQGENGAAEKAGGTQGGAQS